MRRRGLKIGLALSGGGMRAIIFHLGVLKYLAERKLLENIEYISTVSGGSICIALIYSNNNMRWAGSEEYLTRILPNIEKILLKIDIESKLIIRSIVDILHIFDTKSKKLATTMKKYLGIEGKIGDLERRPTWCINAVTYETGMRFFFSQEWCGDRSIGYFRGEEVKVGEAISASAGFPILIGVYKLKRELYEWYDITGIKKVEQPRGKLHLWDGGVYDNLGLEPIYELMTEERSIKRINFCIISDAGAEIESFSQYRRGVFGRTEAIKRLLDIAANKVNMLNIECFLEHILKEENGFYVKIGESPEEILREYGCTEVRKRKLIESMLASKECQRVGEYETDLKRPSVEDFNRIMRHGYEMMKLKFIEKRG